MSRLSMFLDEYIIVRVTADQKRYSWWIMQGPPPQSDPSSQGNETTSASTLGTAIQTAMPTLGT
jgi:hypothetical protein